MTWPTTDDPREVFVTIRLTASEAADLDAYAARRAQTRSAAVRHVLGRVITAEKRRKPKHTRDSGGRS